MVLPQTQGATGPPIASAPSGESQPRPQAWAKVTSHETPDLALHLQPSLGPAGTLGSRSGSSKGARLLALGTQG